MTEKYFVCYHTVNVGTFIEEFESSQEAYDSMQEHKDDYPYVLKGKHVKLAPAMVVSEEYDSSVATKNEERSS